MAVVSWIICVSIMLYEIFSRNINPIIFSSTIVAIAIICIADAIHYNAWTRRKTDD